MMTGSGPLLKVAPIANQKYEREDIFYFPIEKGLSGPPPGR